MIWDILEENTFDSYFSNQTLEIQTLLLDQNIITELKNLNPNLINYIEKNKHNIILKLIEYTTVLPKPDQSQDRIHKLPYVCSEVLAIDNSLIFNEFIKPQKTEGQTYFNKLINILNTDSINNQILLGYFQKVMNNLYNCRKIQTSKLIFQNKKTFLNHLNKPAVGTIIKNCIILLECQEGVVISERKQIIQNIIQRLAQGTQQEKLVIGSVLVQVIQKFQTFSSGDQLLWCILNCPKLQKVFYQQSSIAIDMFLTGYFHKALQKIFSTDNTYKPILQIPKQHSQLAFYYLKRKKHILKQDNFNKKKEDIQFLNQSRRIMKKIDQKIIILLNLIKLGMENKLGSIFQPQDIDNLWILLESHPFNDIMKITIFKIFSLILQQSNQSPEKKYFLYNYQQKTIKLFELNKQMFGQHLFNLFKFVSKKEIINPSYALQSQWKPVQQYFQKCQNLAVEIQKTMNRYSNSTKVTKLVVDEQDNSIQTQLNMDKIIANEAGSQYVQTNSKDEKTIFFQDSFKIDSKINNMQKQQFQTKKVNKKDPFADFSFFEEKKTQEPLKSQKKSFDFSDFSAFM